MKLLQEKGMLHCLEVVDETGETMRLFCLIDFDRYEVNGLPAEIEYAIGKICAEESAKYFKEHWEDDEEYNISDKPYYSDWANDV